MQVGRWADKHKLIGWGKQWETVNRANRAGVEGGGINMTNRKPKTQKHSEYNLNYEGS